MKTRYYCSICYGEVLNGYYKNPEEAVLNKKQRARLGVDLCEGEKYEIIEASTQGAVDAIHKKQAEYALLRVMGATE